MDKKLKKKWVEALLSGEYEQGAGCLEDEGKYCCLGVLCDVSGVYSEGTGYLCVDDDFILLPKEEQEELASLNDYGVPFDMIAGLIDEAL